MRYQSLTIFALFFGITLLEAIQGKHWLSAFAWFCVGLFFVAIDLLWPMKDTAGEPNDRTRSTPDRTAAAPKA